MNNIIIQVKNDKSGNQFLKIKKVVRFECS